MKRIIFSLCILIAFQQITSAQDSTKAKKSYKNTIHINLTNPIIFGGNSYVLGYERVLNKRRTFSINFGSQGFPSLGIIDSDSLKANTILSDRGYNLSIDYRFYLGKENKYEAPRGIYIGPYFSSNYFEKKHTWTLKSTSGGAPQTVESKTSLNANTFGVEMGYQFVFWNRIALDFVLIGPGVATYKFQAKLLTSVSEADKQKFYDKINDALAEKFPGYGFVVDESSFKRTGTENTTSFGFRYMIQLGFRF